jgi:hypothetical protein
MRTWHNAEELDNYNLCAVGFLQTMIAFSLLRTNMAIRNPSEELWTAWIDAPSVFST